MSNEKRIITGIQEASQQPTNFFNVGKNGWSRNENVGIITEIKHNNYESPSGEILIQYEIYNEKGLVVIFENAPVIIFYQ